MASPLRLVADLNLLAAVMAGIDLPLLSHRDIKPKWMADGSCVEHPEVSFFPARGQPTAPAKAICSTCLVQNECLAFALDHLGTVGVWGGTSERERKRLRSQRRRAA